MRYTLQQVVDGWESCRRSASSRTDFQKKWTAFLEEAGWTRQDYHQAIDSIYLPKERESDENKAEKR